ncbi:MAG TPA: hypothetical protein VLA56_06445 [Pseudomonadales bacterium]|nr:hypothetical protein [Pseudomonadales bacterium]
MSLTVVLVILVPLVLFGWLVTQAMPTPRDRQLSRLRTRARALDISVTMVHVPDPDPDAESRVSSSGQALEPKLELAAYARGLRLPTGVEKRHVPTWRLLWMRHHADETLTAGLPPGWRFERTGLPLLDPVLGRLSELLARVPKGTVTVEATATGCTIAWRERGDDTDVEAVGAVLDDLVAFQLELARRAARDDQVGRERRES